MIRLLSILILLSSCAISHPDTARWDTIERINREVNSEIVYWNKGKDWQLPDEQNRGDCSTSVKVKRQRLEAEGIVSEIRVYQVDEYNAHAVVYIDGYILDSNHDGIYKMNQNRNWWFK